jgi:hypothetical protein
VPRRAREWERVYSLREKCSATYPARQHARGGDWFALEAFEETDSAARSKTETSQSDFVGQCFSREKSQIKIKTTAHFPVLPNPTRRALEDEKKVAES